MATSKNTICLWYNGDAEEAARFYAARPSRTRPSARSTRAGRLPAREEGATC